MKLTDEQALAIFETVQKRHRQEIAEVVCKIARGRTAAGVARLLGFSDEWVLEHLKLAAFHHVMEDEGQPCGAGSPKRDELRQVLTKHVPPLSELKESYIEDYEAEGHTPTVAKVLACSYQATERAIKKGTLKLKPTLKHQRAQVDLEMPAVAWELKAKKISMKVREAAKALDDANIHDLRRVATRKLIAEAHTKWMEQIDRVRNFHPTFDEEVEALVQA